MTNARLPEARSARSRSEEPFAGSDRSESIGDTACKLRGRSRRGRLVDCAAFDIGKKELAMFTDKHFTKQHPAIRT
jgi:hypothetical protein